LVCRIRDTQKVTRPLDVMVEAKALAVLRLCAQVAGLFPELAAEERGLREPPEQAAEEVVPPGGLEERSRAS
jgi:hypothetical protein